MIGKGKSISHGVAALEYDLAKEIDGQAAATEIARHELYGCTGAEMVQEMKPYHIDFPNVKNMICCAPSLIFYFRITFSDKLPHESKPAIPKQRNPYLLYKSHQTIYLLMSALLLQAFSPPKDHQ